MSAYHYVLPKIGHFWLYKSDAYSKIQSDISSSRLFKGPGSLNFSADY